MPTDQEVTAIRNLLALVGTDDAIRVDDVERLQVYVSDASVETAISAARDANAVGAIVQFQTEISDEALVLEAHDDGWSADGDISLLDQSKSRYSDAEVTAHFATMTLVATFSKDHWGPVWIGWSVSSLSRWLQQINPRVAAEAIFAGGPARLGVIGWAGATVSLGPALVLGSPDTVEPNVTTSWPERRPAWQSMGATVDPEQAPQELRESISAIGCIAAIHLLSEYVRDRNDGGYELGLSHDDVAPFTLAQSEVNTYSSAVRAVVEWVSREPTLTRLAVARRSFRSRLDSGGRSASLDELVAQAETAYAAAVDFQVSQALDAQAQFENHIVEFSSKTNAVVREIDKTTDDVVTRTITALVAILITGVFAKDVRGWPLLLAAVFVAAYVLWSAWHVLGSYKLDLRANARLLEQAAATRPYGMANRAAVQLNAIESNARGRIRFRQAVLALLAAAVLATGVIIVISDNDPTSQNPTTPAQATPGPTNVTQ